MKSIQIAAAALVASAYTTMVLGAYVKAIGAGMACPDYPTCKDGAFVPPLDSAGVAAEIAHRIAAAAVAASGALLLGLQLLHYRAERRLLALTLVGAAAVAVQLLLGMLTIATNLMPIVVTAHLAVGTMIFGLSLLVAVRVWKLPPPHAAAARAEAPARGSAEGGSAQGP